MARNRLIAESTFDSLTGEAVNLTGPRSTLTIAYDAIGNLMSRSDVGSYTYHATRRHAVIAAGANSYSYDANGNMITRNGASVGWRSDNLPSVINAAGYSAQFDYGPDGQRWRQVGSYASGRETVRARAHGPAQVVNKRFVPDFERPRLARGRGLATVPRPQGMHRRGR